jgi:hypothetical protein
MSIELVLWGIIPAALAAVAITISLYCMIRRASISQVLFLIPIVAGMGWSLLMLYSIFISGAWPTYIPHIIIGLLLPVVIGQWAVAGRPSPDA